MKNLIKVLSLFFLLVTLTTCKKDPPTPITSTNFNDKGNIGSEGGSVKTSDGASVEIPAGALSSIQLISIENTTQNDTLGNSDCRIYELKPDGLKFSDSITIKLPFDDTYID